jgi:hypothetical protein
MVMSRASADGEQASAGKERGPTSQNVARPCAQQQQSAESEGVGVDHPGQVGGGEVQRARDVGQRNVHDGRVKDNHELAGQDHGKDEAGVPVGQQPAARSGLGRAEGVVRQLRAGCGVVGGRLD